MNENDFLLYFFLVIMPILIVVFAFITFYVGSFSQLSGSVFPEAQYQIYESVLLRDCLVDEEKGFGVIDIDKFTDDNLHECLGLKDAREGGLMLDLIHSEGADYIETQNLRSVMSGSERKFYEYPVIVNEEVALLKITYLHY